MKGKLLPAAFTLCLLIAALPLNAMGGVAEADSKEYMKDNGKRVTISGTARLVGNMPFTEFVISSEDGDWFVDKDDEDKFEDGQTVTVMGTAHYSDIVLANGKKTGVKRTLSDVMIIK
jgi:hypothetical protein